ncbi:DUF7504 family protein [Haladaptatus sp. NG-WS-4]
MLHVEEFAVGERHGATQQRPSEVIGEVVERDDHPPTSQLSGWLDPSALDRLFAPKYDGSKRTGGRVSFRYDKDLVTVVSTGKIFVHRGVRDRRRGANRESKPTEESTEDTTLPRVTKPIRGTVSQAVIEAVASVKTIGPTQLRQQLYDVVEPDALNELFDVESDATSEPRGDVSFTFDDCDVTVDSTGTVTVQSVVPKLEADGGNFLVVGDVPDGTFTAVGSTFFDPPFGAQQPLLAFCGEMASVVRDRRPQLDGADAQVVVSETGTRPTAALAASKLGAELADRIDSLETPRPHLYFDGVAALVHDQSPATAESVLTRACSAVTTADGIGHYVFRDSPESHHTRKLAPLFDGVIELRNDGSGIQRRWHLHEESYTTRWFRLD